jgi:prephenate dehydrogenase
MINKIGIVGLGLIGGSLAMAVKKKCPHIEITAYNRSKEPLEKALSDGVIDRGVSKIGEEFDHQDIIFLCTPVQTNISFLKLLKPYLGADTVLSDVGSTKENIHEAVREILPGVRFIGGHPMAGKEKSSYFNPSAELLEGSYYFITPSDTAEVSDVEAFEGLVRDMGCIPITVEPEKHDFIVGAISHVPHIAAYTLVELVRDEDSPEEYMRETAAGGFKDITRVASSDPTMWEEICLANRENLTLLMDRYIEKLKDVRELIAGGRGEELHRIFREAKEYRDSFIR